MATFGMGYHMHVTGLTHDERGYPVMDPSAQEQMIGRITGKIQKNLRKIISYDTLFMDDAEIVVVAYGISARSAKGAVQAARAQGLKVGLMKLNTVWPFPEEAVSELAGRVKGLIMPEINQGQVVLELQRLAAGRCPVRFIGHPGGTIISPRAIVAAIEEMSQGRRRGGGKEAS
jgi:2-oxoglutarate ferredoxin oxidoreductase subunit alpha